MHISLVPGVVGPAEAENQSGARGRQDLATTAIDSTLFTVVGQP
jgi:hypothetical protein